MTDAPPTIIGWMSSWAVEGRMDRNALDSGGASQASGNHGETEEVERPGPAVDVL